MLNLVWRIAVMSALFIISCGFSIASAKTFTLHAKNIVSSDYSLNSNRSVVEVTIKTDENPAGFRYGADGKDREDQDVLLNSESEKTYTYEGTHAQVQIFETTPGLPWLSANKNVWTPVEDNENLYVCLGVNQENSEKRRWVNFSTSKSDFSSWKTEKCGSTIPVENLGTFTIDTRSEAFDNYFTGLHSHDTVIEFRLKTDDENQSGEPIDQRVSLNWTYPSEQKNSYFYKGNNPRIQIFATFPGEPWIDVSNGWIPINNGDVLYICHGARMDISPDYFVYNRWVNLSRFPFVFSNMINPECGKVNPDLQRRELRSHYIMW